MMPIYVQLRMLTYCIRLPKNDNISCTAYVSYCLVLLFDALLRITSVTFSHMNGYSPSLFVHNESVLYPLARLNRHVLTEPRCLGIRLLPSRPSHTLSYTSLILRPRVEYTAYITCCCITPNQALCHTSGCQLTAQCCRPWCV